MNDNAATRNLVGLEMVTLEDAGLLERIGVEIHPDPYAPPGTYPGVEFSDLGLLTNLPFDLAYKAAEEFTAARIDSHFLLHSNFRRDSECADSFARFASSRLIRAYFTAKG